MHFPKSEQTSLVAKLRAALASGDSGRIAAARRAMDEDDAQWASVAFSTTDQGGKDVR